MTLARTSARARFTGPALLFRIRAKAAAKATAQAVKSLHDGQPLIATGSTYLCNGYLGDVRLDLYGTVDRLRSGFAVDVDDVAISGTQISLRESLSGKQWDDLHKQALIAIEEQA